MYSIVLTLLVARRHPKSLLGLPIHLIVEYYELNPNKQKFLNKGKLDYPSLLHHAIFSNNILAVVFVVNSNIFHAKETCEL